MKKKVVYIEPADYFPEELRKKYKLGEYAEKREKKSIDVENDYISKETRKELKIGEYAENNVEVEISVTVETKDGALKANNVEEVEKVLESLDK